MKLPVSVAILSTLVALPAAAGVVSVPAVPEPSAFGLFAVGAAVAALGYRVGRKR
jgi:hypothetical protein